MRSSHGKLKGTTETTFHAQPRAEPKVNRSGGCLTLTNSARYRPPSSEPTKVAAFQGGSWQERCLSITAMQLLVGFWAWILSCAFQLPSWVVIVRLHPFGRSVAMPALAFRLQILR